MNDVVHLQKTANLVRQDIITMLAQSGSGHSAGSLGITDISVALYFKLLNIDPKHPQQASRDRLILSHGHVCPALYATLARAGFFSKTKLNSLRQIDSPLQGHPHLGSLPGIENSSGPLGQGVSMAVGLALATKRDKKDWLIVCLTSDGEQQEGQVWEAYLLASKYQLDNLIFILDANNIQIGGQVSEIMPLKPLKSKYQSFGLSVDEIDGHDFNQIETAFLKAKSIKNQPKIIIAQTVAGKGVDFMQRQAAWHGRAPNKKETKKALTQLKNQYEEIGQKHEQ